MPDTTKTNTVTFSERPPSTCSSIPFATKPPSRSGLSSAGGAGAPPGVVAQNALNPAPASGAAPGPAAPVVLTQNLHPGLPPAAPGSARSEQALAPGSAGGSARGKSPAEVVQEQAEVLPASARSAADQQLLATAEAQAQQQMVSELQQDPELQQHQPESMSFVEAETNPVYHEGRYIAYKARVKNLGGCQLRPPFAKDYDDETAQDLPPPWLVRYPERAELPPIGGPGEPPLPTAATSVSKTQAFLENRHIAHHCQMRDRFGSRIFG